MTMPDPQIGGASGLPDPAGLDVPAATVARHDAGDRPRRPSRRDRRREQRRQEGRERYGFRDFLHDVVDFALDVLLFWR